MSFTSEITVTLVAHHGGDERIANKAWISTNKGDNRSEDDVSRLVRFLYKHGHCQAFMGSGVAFKVEAPYRTLVQVIRHMTANPCEPVDIADIHINVVQSSARYGHVPTDIYKTKGLKALAIQAGVDEDVWHLINCAERCLNLWHSINNKLTGKQNDLRDEINNYLPQGVMGSIDIDFNCWSFKNFVEKRVNAHAQATIQEIAWKMVNAVDGIPEFATFMECLHKDVGHRQGV
jgi:thymidylate synthase ThyX